MLSWLAKYRERLRLQHGWEVELRCTRCGTDAVPRYDGWTPTPGISFGDNPTIYANLACPKCAADLRGAAGRKLVELFRPIHTANRALIVTYVAVTLATVVLSILITWGLGQWTWLSLLPLLAIRPLMLWFNDRAAAHSHRCPCGQPAYKFMGMLGRSLCYRCSSCGRLLRVRN